MGLGSGKDKDDMAGRFFQGLQQGIESLPRQHVDFVDDVNLISTLRRCVTDILPQLPTLIDSSI